MVAVDLQLSGTTTARTSQKPAKCQFSNKITWQERGRTRRVRNKYRVKVRISMAHKKSKRSKKLPTAGFTVTSVAVAGETENGGS